MPRMHVAIPFAVSFATVVQCSRPHLVLKQLPAWWGGGPILYQPEDPLTVTITATTDDDLK